MRIELARPELLWLLALLPLWALLVWPRAGRGVPYARASAAARPARRPDLVAAAVLLAPRALTAAALAVLVLALAGPERVLVEEERVLEGRGLGLVVDLSSSMLAEDMDTSSRVSVARNAAIRFARRRVHDELSLVGFGSDALTRVPPTRDPELIVQGVESLDVELVRDGTDISGAVLAAVSRLLESEREPRVIVLLTDGAHNGAELPPLVTARAAAALGVRIHAISIVAPEQSAPSLAAAMVQRRFGEERETVLQRLAAITGGEYFRATGPAALDSIYGEIDRLEAPVERVLRQERREPLRAWLFLLGLALVAAEALLRGSRWGVVH
ncbi:MAG TPA: VWA domain-containing protein [Longimicrobiales bacterium]|nr:VWA domain-containing protein [Longimicrobiales bacterium]